LLSYFSDVDDAPHLLQFGIVHNSNPSLFSGLQFSSQGVLTLGFAPDQHGVALLTVQATDPHGDSRWTTFAVRVAPVADAPTFVPIPDLTVQESAPPYELRLGEYFAAPDAGQLLRFEVVSNSNPDLASPQVWFDSLFVRFAAGQSGVADITVRGTQTNGAEVMGTWRIVVNPVNDPPVVNELAPIDAPQGSSDLTIEL